MPSRSDKENIAAVVQAVADLKESLPMLVEVAAAKGAQQALAAHAPLLEKLADRVGNVEKDQLRINTAVKTLRWVGAGTLALTGLLVKFWK